MKKGTFEKHRIDMECAREIVDSFSYSCQVNCQLLSENGSCLLQREPVPGLCASCERVLQDGKPCKKNRLYGAYQAERFGGRYIYFCEMGMAWTSSPILIGGRPVASLLAGPVLIMRADDYMAGTASLCNASEKKQRDTVKVLKRFPNRLPAEMSHISLQLLSDAVYIGGTEMLLVERKEYASCQQSISECLQQLKSSKAATAYPIEAERALTHAITEGDHAEARHLLNEILGHVLFLSGGEFSVVRARSLELMALFSRAAVKGGASLTQVLELNGKFLKESDYLTSVDDLTSWMIRGLNRYAAMVFSVPSTGRRDVTENAIHYIKENLSEKITLDAAARRSGFSIAHFSRVFKKEIGMSFSEYLIHLRIERSKALLLSTALSVSLVSAAVGYEDESYFIRVFRERTGTTPGQYRKKQGRLKHKSERDSVN